MKNLWLIVALFLLGGCTHVFSEQARQQVDPALTFEQLKRDANSYAGKYIKVGGIIAEVKNTEQGSQVEIVQFNLGRDDIPDESTSSGGRFLAQTPDYLDNMIYKKGRPVAVIGRVEGARTLPLDQTQYTYPVIAIQEIHVWKKSEVYYNRPPYYYDPFFYPHGWYGPPYYPYWYPYRYRHWR